MPRVLKKKPLRGSVRQNTAPEEEEEGSRFAFLFGFWPRLGMLVLGAIAAILFAGWLWHGAWPNQKAGQLREVSLHSTQRLGFSIKDVTVEGRVYTDKESLLAALGIGAGAPTYSFNPDEAYERIMNLPWTKNATVIRSLPDKIIVRLTERQPIARWQHDDKTVVIDDTGRELTAARAEQFAALPLVVGTAAPEQTEPLLHELRDYPEVMRVLKAAVRVSGRRWNFYIQPDLLVKMPEMDMKSALDKLTKLIQEQRILDRNIQAIDLRIPMKMFIEPRGAKDSAEPKEATP